ncbi:unnamed protein product, partial [Prorocentrum cordatum]
MELDQLATNAYGVAAQVADLDSFLLKSFEEGFFPAGEVEVAEETAKANFFACGVKQGDDRVLEELHGNGYRFGMKCAAGKRYKTWLKNRAEEEKEYDEKTDAEQKKYREKWGAYRYGEHVGHRSKVTGRSQKKRQEFEYEEKSRLNEMGETWEHREEEHAPKKRIKHESGSSGSGASGGNQRPPAAAAAGGQPGAEATPGGQ